jgi:CubicO group peptidase (beta-lactamase class C family)
MTGGGLLGRELYGDLWVTGEESLSGVAVTQPSQRVPGHLLRTGALVAAASERGKTAHAARVTSTWPDHPRPGDAPKAYTLRTVCGWRAGVGRLGDLGFNPDATHHGWRRTCHLCAVAVEIDRLQRAGEKP